MSEYDQTCKIAARAVDAAGFLRWALPPEIVAPCAFESWLPTETLAMPGEPDRRCDTVAGFQHQAGTEPPLAWVVEFQTTARPRTLPRLGEYSLRVHREVLLQRDPLVPYQVLCAVVYLTGPPQANHFALEVPVTPTVVVQQPEAVPALRASRVGLRITVEVVNVPGMDAAATLEAVAAGTISRAVLPFVALMRGANDPKRVVTWREVTGVLRDQQERATLGFLTLTLAKLVAWTEVWKRGMEGWAVEESPYWNEIRAGGRDEGQVEHARQALLRLLRSRFGDAVAGELTPRIAQLANLSALDRCLDLIVPGDLEKIRTLLSTAK